MKTNNYYELNDFEMDIIFTSKYLFLTSELIEKQLDFINLHKKKPSKDLIHLRQLINETAKFNYLCVNKVFSQYPTETMDEFSFNCKGISEVNKVMFSVSALNRGLIINRATELYIQQSTGLNPKEKNIKAFAEKHRLSKKALEELKEIL